MRTCFLLGAHDAPSSIQEQLNQILDYLVRERNVSEFIVGMRGNFDSMAISAIQRVIRLYPEKELTALLLEPYIFQERRRYVPAYFSNFFCPQGMETVPKRLCIEAANRKTLDESDVFVTYVYLTGSNSGKILQRARWLEKQGYMEVYDLKESMMVDI